MILSAPSELKIWRRIKLGTGLKIADDFREALKGKDHKQGDLGDEILGKKSFTVAAKLTEVDLVLTSTVGLGFDETVRYDRICVRAKELGLEICPAEVGPQLRLQYLDQPLGECLYVAMNAIKASCYCYPSIFCVGRNRRGDLYLGGFGEHDMTFGRSMPLVFVSPQALVA